MAWSTPKTNWTSADPIGTSDLNRIEGNLLHAVSYASNTLTIGNDSSNTTLSFKTGGSVRGVINSLGNLLVGTTSDNSSGAKLQVNGFFSFDGSVGSIMGGSAGNTLEFTRPNVNYIRAKSVDGAIVFLVNGDALSTTNSPFWIGANKRVNFQDVDSVLINTATDNGSGAKLQVNGATSLDGALALLKSGVQKAALFIGSSDQLVLNAGGSNFMIVEASAPTNSLYIKSTGNVLINTATDNGSGAKLQVNGGLSYKAREIVFPPGTTHGTIFSTIAPYVPNVGDIVAINSTGGPGAQYNCFERTSSSVITIKQRTTTTIQFTSGSSTTIGLEIYVII